MARTAWNKGKKMPEETKLKLSASLKGRKSWNKGVPCTEEHKLNISKGRTGIDAWNKGRTKKTDPRIDYFRPTAFKKADNVGEDNFKWEGDDVSYRNLHRWIERKLGKATKCEKCGESPSRMHWSNDDHTYKREVEGWTQLCPKCHAQHDKLLRRLNGVNSVDILT